MYLYIDYFCKKHTLIDFLRFIIEDTTFKNTVS